MDLLPHTGKRVYPVGRLDKDTEGLLIVTNDGDLTYRLTHPKHHVDKVYLAYVAGNPADESLDKLRRGIMLQDGMTSPAIVDREDYPDGSCLRITIHEGRKRQVRRMFASLSHEVLALKRIRMGNLGLGSLAEGRIRQLSVKEVRALLNQT